MAHTKKHRAPRKLIGVSSSFHPAAACIEYSHFCPLLQIPNDKSFWGLRRSWVNHSSSEEQKHQVFTCVHPYLRLEQKREVVESLSHCRVVAAQRFLQNCDRTVVQLPGLIGVPLRKTK